ncbi:hypothetical protein KS4_22390 [Poriferisphaera corsica]|uniref:DUF2029 domain-containing protein n=1 Tax=Poriferisphaera corsica TaxID=2528020 RepID=A0A517YVD3_9BACT|nr:glycosyltransferase family 87 protein [Poriferisphaera corsica]QDU34177.1 hypothetical protein KS4_22390 [Poriferisphaera corsica]
MMKIDLQCETKATWAIWCLVTVGILLVSVWSNYQHTVTGAYIDGSLRWLLQQDLYDYSMHGFLYLPQSAIFYSPFAVLPEWIGENLWRVTSIFCFASGLYTFTDILMRYTQRRWFLWMSLACIPMILDSARNGQMTLMLVAMMLMSVSDLIESRYSRMVFWLIIGLVIKPLMIVMILLIAGIYPKTMWRIMIGLCVFLAIPMFQSGPTYTIDQYHGFYLQSVVSATTELLNEGRFSDVFGALKAWGVHINGELQLFHRISFALITWLLCLSVANRFSRVVSACTILIMCISYIMLFNPRTEINTFSMFSIVIALVMCFGISQQQLSLVISVIIAGLIIALNYEILKNITPGRTYWLPPIVTVSVLIFLIPKCYRCIRQNMQELQEGRQSSQLSNIDEIKNQNEVMTTSSSVS